MNLLSTRSNRCALRRSFAAACGWLALAGVAGSSIETARAQCSPIERIKLIASDSAALDEFGSAVALSGDTAIVGTRGDDDEGPSSGSVYVFVRSGELWTEQAKLTASDAAALDEFGSAVALSGDTAVVGAYGDDGAGSASGSVYVFVRLEGVWTQQAKLTASDADANDAFGLSLGVSGDTVVVGAWGDDNAGGFQAGSAYVFNRTDGVWTEQVKLTASDAAGQEYFGKSAAVSGDTAVIGAFADDHAGGTGAGSAYVFVRVGGVWTQQAKLIASDAAASDQFGISAAVAGDTTVVGAMKDDHAGATDAGSAYVFTRAGSVWTQQAKLTASDAAAGDEFGVSVALSDETVLVGVDLDDHEGGTDAGSAYVFIKPGGGWTNVTETAKLIASDAAGSDQFGISVAVSGATTMVGANLGDHAGGSDAGSAYVIECTIPGCPVPIFASDAAANDWFGNVAFDGDTIVVGARQDDNATGNDAGAAYVYVKSGPPGNETWTEQAKLIGDEPVFGLETGDQSGVSVDVSGNTAMVGSWLWPNGTATGLIYIFDRSGPPGGEVWTQKAALACPQFGSYQYFGVSVALEGDSAVVGSLVAAGLNVGGQAFFYRRTGGESWISQQVFPSDGVPGDQFGISVAMSPSQDTAVVGAWLDDNAGGTDAGSAYVFVRSGNSWVEQAKLIATDGATTDQFGRQVAIDGDTVVVGSRWDDHAGGANAGSAYVFTRSGTVWTEQAKLTASDAAAGDEFGLVLTISGDTLIVGAYADDHAAGVDAGSAYVFERSGPAGSEVWTEQLKLTAPAAAAGDVFGGSVALAGDTAVISSLYDDHAGGTDAGSAYVFDLNCTGTACPGDRGDANCDGSVNFFDIDPLLMALFDQPTYQATLCGGQLCAADADCSGAVNFFDIDPFLTCLFGGCAACP